MELYAGAVQTNNPRVPSAFKADGAMTLTQSVKCSVDDDRIAYGVTQAIPIRRHYGYVLGTYAVPTLLCSCVGILSLFTPIGVAMPRFAASVIGMLTVATIKRTLDSTLPATGQDSLLVLWLMVQMIILAICSICTQIGFILKYDAELQHYADFCYRISVILLFLLSVPIAYACISLGSDHDVINFVALITPALVAMLVPSIFVYIKYQDRMEQLSRWDSLMTTWKIAKKAKGTATKIKNAVAQNAIQFSHENPLSKENDDDGFGLQDNFEMDMPQSQVVLQLQEIEVREYTPLSKHDVQRAVEIAADASIASSTTESVPTHPIIGVDTAMDPIEPVEQKPQKGLTQQITEWFDHNGLVTFHRYDLDNSGTINSTEELSQLAFYIYTKLDAIMELPGKFNANTFDDIQRELDEHADLDENFDMSFEEFVSWFVNFLLTMPTPTN